VLTFRSGAVYCCYKPGCHLGFFDGKRWDVLHEVLATHGIGAPSRLKLRLTRVVEEGQYSSTSPNLIRRGWYAFRPVTAYRYQESATEASLGDN
jgi:hypothetical protein